MVRMRIFDDRMMKMQRTGKLSFYMRSYGEEAVAIVQTMALKLRIGYSLPTDSLERNLSEEEIWSA